MAGTLVVFGLRSPDPRVADPARWAALQGSILRQASAADAALVGLDQLLDAALTSARRGSAATVAGDRAPDVHLLAAAETLDGAAGAAAVARSAIDHLDGLLAAWDPAGASPVLALPDGELAAIGAQLRAAAPAAVDFADHRRSTEATVEALGRAIAALDRGDVDAALAAVGEAERHLEAVRAWDAGLVTLPIWIDTTGSLLGALERLAEATAAGDDEAVRAAVADYQRAAEEAHQADLALTIALSEGGSAVAAAPLHRLSEALRRVAETRAAVSLVLVTRP